MIPAGSRSRIELVVAGNGPKTVGLAARSGDALKSVADEVMALGRKAVAITMDVSKVSDCRRAASEAADALGGLDILVNNAGVEQVCPSLEVEEDLWKRLLAQARWRSRCPWSPSSFTRRPSNMPS